MSDPFQDVDSRGEEFVKAIGDALELRAAEPVMLEIVEAYLSEIPYPDGGVHLEIGTGSGAIARALARHANNGTVIASDPSTGLIDYAKAQATDIENLRFERADGSNLSHRDASVDTVIMHTVLSHVTDPSVLLEEAARVLKPGGTLVICDADFEKMSIGNAQGDPLNACAVYFAENFVTDKYLIGKLRALVSKSGFSLETFRVSTRIISQGLGGMTWVGLGGKAMVDRGLIGQPLADALVAEYHRRIEADELYGFIPFATLVARR